MYVKVRRFNSEQRNNPVLKDHPSYKNGITCYREFAFSKYENHCNRCHEKNCKLEVHHIDNNRQNNEVENLEILCLSCHRKHHKSKSSEHL